MRHPVAKMFELSGTKPAAAKKAADTVFAFEKQLAEASLDERRAARPDAAGPQDHVRRAAEAVPHFDWARYFDALKLPRGDLNVLQPKFLAEFDERLEQSSLADWRTYLRWQLLGASADYLSKPFVEEHFAFNSGYLTGAKEMKARATRCAETPTTCSARRSASATWTVLPAEAKARMQDMVKNILLAMEDTIRGLDWMSAETKQKALEKLARSTQDRLSRQVEGLRRRESSRALVLGRRRSRRALERRRQPRQIGKPVDRRRWGMTPPTSNAYYNPLLNEIVFPAGILQPPAFDVTATDAVNYGAIGVVIGHEISHGFDDQGAQFDAQGRSSNWWTPRTSSSSGARPVRGEPVRGLLHRAGIHHNGKLVLGESIGDLAGAKLAFAPTRSRAKGKGPEPTIDGFTPEQQFFIAWGQWRGDEIRAETQRRWCRAIRTRSRSTA
jgi:endothelin-converting enzyme/putative endopeptidase